MTIGGQTSSLSDAREARQALDARYPPDATLPSLSATAAVVIETASGHVLAGRHDTRSRFPASLVKVMTLLVALDALREGRASVRDTVRISPFAAHTPHPRLACGQEQRVPFGALLEALVVRSSNLAATAIAEHIAGSERAFVDAMNAAARRLRLHHTQFATPHGLPHRHQRTTAGDMARLFAHVLQAHPRARRLLGRDSITVLGRQYRRVVPLLVPGTGVVAVKTGFTWESGYNLAAAWRVRRRLRVGVVLGSVSRRASYEDMRRLMQATS